jgi:iron complex transport system permease protein
VAVEPLRRSLFFLGALLTAAAVSTGGSIGFVGLVVPHLTRRIAGASHRWLVPNSVLLGGGLLLLADTLAKILIAPRQLPVGILTALLGVPWFLWLLTRKTP